MDKLRRIISKELLLSPIGILIMLLTLVATIAGVMFSLALQPVHGIRVTTLTSTSIVKIAEGFSDDLQVLYDGTPVINPVLVDLVLDNSGNQPVMRGDFDSPLRFVFPEDVEIATAELLETRPAGIDATIVVSSSEALLEPLLINAGDRLQFRFVLLTNHEYSGTMPYNIVARIANIPAIVPENIIDVQLNKDIASAMVWLGVMLGAVAFIALLVVILNQHGRFGMQRNSTE